MNRRSATASRGWWRAALAVAGAAALAGCAGGRGPFAPLSLAPPAATAPQVARPAPRRPVARPAPPRPTAPAPGDLAGNVPANAPVALAGASAERVEAQFGPPASRAASGSGERWTYRTGDCSLDLFLFPDVSRGGLAVLDRRASGADAEDCARRLRDARGQ